MNTLVDLFVELTFNDPDDAIGALDDIMLNHEGVVLAFNICGESARPNPNRETVDVRVVAVVEHAYVVDELIEDILEGSDVETWEYYEYPPIELGEDVDNFQMALAGYLADHPTLGDGEEEGEGDGGDGP